MSKIANYLGNHLRGEVLTTASKRDHNSKDGSVLRILPLLVAYPFATNDIRKITHFAWQLAEKGHALPLVARGSGSNNVGAAIGAGLVVSLTEHFDNILEVDTKQRLVRLQPGVTMKNLQTAMHTHGLMWPVDSHNSRATVGGAVANNLCGERGGAYGPAAAWIDQLEVVLASGESIQTKRLSKRELNKKKGLNTMEGEIYRQLDNLLSDNAGIIGDLATRPGSTGYALASIKDKKGNFDLTPLIAGSQGTLGIISEAIIKLTPHSTQSEVIAASLSSTDELEKLVSSLKKHNPARIEFIDGVTLGFATQKLGMTLPELLHNDEAAASAGLLLIELNESGRLKPKAKKIEKTLHKFGHSTIRSNGDVEVAAEMKQSYQRLINLLVSSETDDHKITVPAIEDALVPPTDTTSFIASVHALAKKHRATMVLWAHLGSGVIHARPMLNLRNLSDKQKLKKLIDEYYQLVIKTDGSVAGEYGEGRLRAHVGAKQFSDQENELFQAVKKIFDSYGIFNPGVKLSDGKDSLGALNESYSH